jgi:hypothetical protein
MNTSWFDFASGTQLYWAVAVFASVLQVFLLVGALMGGGHDFDHGADSHDGSTTDAVKILSLRVLVAFFVGFGWAGVMGQRNGMSPGSTALAALISGVIFMLLLFATLRLLMSMRDDGSLHYENAIGLRGQVYVTIPAVRAGIGQIEVMLQGRLITASAVTDADHALAPQHGIEITALMPPNTFVVKPTS